MRKLTIISILFLLTLLTGCSGIESNVEPADITVIITSSLSKPMEDIKNSFEANHNITLKYETANSEEITNSIISGKLVDLIILSSEKNMNELQKDQLIDSESRNNLVSNSLVIVTQTSSTLSSFEELATENVNKIAVGDPNTTSCGYYTIQTLNQMNLGETLGSKLLVEKNVQLLLRDVESGRVEAGIVFKSDAVNNSNIKVIYEFPQDVYDTIYYPMAISSETEYNKQAKVFEDYLLSEEAQKIFNDYGFSTINNTTESEVIEDSNQVSQ